MDSNNDKAEKGEEAPKSRGSRAKPRARSGAKQASRAPLPPSHSFERVYKTRQYDTHAEEYYRNPKEKAPSYIV